MTVLLTLPKQLLKKKGKQKNDHMQVIFYNKGCVWGALRKNNMENNKTFNSQVGSSEGIGI